MPSSTDSRFGPSPNGMTHTLTNPTFFNNFADESQQEYQFSAPGAYAAGAQCASTGRGAAGTCPTFTRAVASAVAQNKQRAKKKLPALPIPTGQKIKTSLDQNGNPLPITQDKDGNPIQTKRTIHVLRNGVGAQNVSRLSYLGHLGADVTGGAHHTGETIMINDRFKLRHALERTGALLNVTNGTCGDNGQCHWSYGAVDKQIKDQHAAGNGGPPAGDGSKKSAKKANSVHASRLSFKQ